MRKTLLLLGISLVAACGTSAGDEGAGGGGSHTGGGSASSSTATSGGGGASCGTSVSTADVECSYAYSAFNSSPSVNTTSTVKWSCSATTRSMTSNGIPDHDTGTFPNANCPNTISSWSASASVTLTPTETGTPSTVGIVGFALNGVKFDPSTAGTCTVSGSSATCSLIGNTGNWNIEALGQTSFNFGVDQDNAHVQPTGEYHYHGMPEAVLTKLGSGAMKPTLVGFALDGFPVYARYGYTDAMESSSAVKVMKGSYQLKATPDSGRPSTSTYPMGAFTQDYEYVAGSGDLDACNGRKDVTPEFPCGIYHYYITDTYPFIQRCVMGTPTGGGEMGGPDGGMGMEPPDGGQLPTCMPGQTSMCCGDGVCEGPETHANCPQDCP
jgi:YHYH protein